MANASPTSEFFGEQLLLEPFKSLVQSSEMGKAPVAKEPKPSSLLGQTSLVKPFTFPSSPHEYKVVRLREYPTPETMLLADGAQRVADFWRMHIPSHRFSTPSVSVSGYCF